MKPIHKFNNGNGATLCHKCNCIISIGFTNDLYCKECIKEQDKKMYSEEDMRKAFKSSSLTNMLDVYESFEEFIEQFKNK
jgi:reverse gyrase